MAEVIVNKMLLAAEYAIINASEKIEIKKYLETFPHRLQNFMIFLKKAFLINQPYILDRISNLISLIQHVVYRHKN